MRKKIFITLVAGIFLLGGPVNAAENLVGQPAPSLTVQQLDGKTFDLSTLRGKVVIVHFWATWCAPCKEEMPVLEGFYQKNKGKGVEVIAISADKSRHQDDVTAAMKGFHFAAAMMDTAAPNGFGAPTEIPVTYVIDPSGIIRAKFTPDENLLSAQLLSNAVQPLRLP